MLVPIDKLSSNSIFHSFTKKASLQLQENLAPKIYIRFTCFRGNMFSFRFSIEFRAWNMGLSAIHCDTFRNKRKRSYIDKKSWRIVIRRIISFILMSNKSSNGQLVNPHPKGDTQTCRYSCMRGHFTFP